MTSIACPPQATLPEALQLAVPTPSEEAALRASARLHAVMAMQSEVCAAGLDQRNIRTKAARYLTRVIPADYGAVAVPIGADELEYVALTGSVTPAHPIRLHVGASITGWSYTHRAAVRCDDIEADPRGSVVARRVLGVRSLIVAPLLARDRCFGAIVVLSRRPAAFDDEDLTTLELLSGCVSAALAYAASAEERQMLLAERTAALEELGNTSELFRALTERSDELVHVLGEDGGFRYTGPGVTQVLGWSPRDLLGRRPTEFVHPDDRDVMVNTFREILADAGGTHTMIVRLKHRDGRWRYLEGFGRNLLHVPAVQGITVNARDVTARVEAEQRLRFHSELLDTVQQGVVAADATGVVTYWNAHAERMFGYPREQALGRGIVEVLPCSVGCTSSPLWNQVVAAGQTQRREARIATREGDTVAVAVLTTPIVENGAVLGAVIVLEDLTEKYLLEEQLRQSQKMEAVGQLAGGVAHDFNNILTSILSYTDMLLEDTKDEAVRRDLMEIRNAGWRAAELTGKLLAFSRKKKAEPVKVDVAREVLGLQGMLRRLLPEEIELHVECPEAPLYLQADRTQIEQVLMNLVVNARDAIAGSGRITVTLEQTAPGAKAAALRVRDTGSGIPEDAIQRIFEPFFTTKPEGKGTGLGLSVVNGIVRQLNGAITVATAPGEGTEFRMEFPLWSEPALVS